MPDPIIRSIIERSLFSSYSLTRMSFATFSANEFLFDGLEDFEKQMSLPWAPSISEKHLRATLSVLERESVDRRFQDLFKDLRLPFAYIHAPPSNEGKGAILMHLLRDALAQQQFAPTVLIQEVEQRRLADAIEEDRLLRSEFGSAKISPAVAGIVAMMFAAGPRVAVEAQDTLLALMRQDIPFSLSPEVRSDTLRNVIQEAKRFAILPLYAGSFEAATAVSNGQYVTALEMAAVGGGATIIVAGSAAVADRLLAVLAKR